MYSVAIITLSDKGFKGEREDKSGPLIQKLLPEDKYKVCRYSILPDEFDLLVKEYKYICDELKPDLILTTGGTGFSNRDITPEATMSIADKNVPGIAEAMRAYSMGITKKAMLSRAVSAIRGETLIVNLPGSPKAIEEVLTYILDVLPHGLDILSGKASECARK